ncbi:hypothetical protein BH11PSE13_BH11PSE13_05010 [soil metagenome]
MMQAAATLAAALLKNTNSHSQADLTNALIVAYRALETAIDEIDTKDNSARAI